MIVVEEGRIDALRGPAHNSSTDVRCAFEPYRSRADELESGTLRIVADSLGSYRGEDMPS